MQRRLAEGEVLDVFPYRRSAEAQAIGRELKRRAGPPGNPDGPAVDRFEVGAYASFFTFSAAGPFWPCTTSN